MNINDPIRIIGDLYVVRGQHLQVQLDHHLQQHVIIIQVMVLYVHLVEVTVQLVYVKDLVLPVPRILFPINKVLLLLVSLNVDERSI